MLVFWIDSQLLKFFKPIIIDKYKEEVIPTSMRIDYAKRIFNI